MSGSCYLSFTVIIPDTVTIDLTELSADVSVSANLLSAARVFSTIDGYDDVTGDTIGMLGYRQSSPAGLHEVVDLADPTVNIDRGANVIAGDFDNLTDTTITFHLPWLDNSTAPTCQADLDNLTLKGKVIPAPSTRAAATWMMSSERVPSVSE